jgi:hypothetical protein
LDRSRASERRTRRRARQRASPCKSCRGRREGQRCSRRENRERHRPAQQSVEHRCACPESPPFAATGESRRVGRWRCAARTPETRTPNVQAFRVSVSGGPWDGASSPSRKGDPRRNSSCGPGLETLFQPAQIRGHLPSRLTVHDERDDQLANPVTREVQGDSSVPTLVRSARPCTTPLARDVAGQGRCHVLPGRLGAKLSRSALPAASTARSASRIRVSMWKNPWTCPS